MSFFFDAKDDYGSLATFQFQYENEQFDKETTRKLKSRIFGMEPYIERSPPNRIINFSSDTENQYFCRIKKIIGNYIEYCDEDGDWRRRYCKIMFVGEDQVGHPKVVGQIQSHPWASVVERLWEDKQEWEPQN